MDDYQLKIMEYASKGMCCTQILVRLGLDLKGLENPDFLRSSRALCGGMGEAGEDCGALTGGCLLLGLFLCGDERVDAHPRAREIISELVDWFRNEETKAYGCTVNCRDILDGDEGNKRKRCPGLITHTFEQCMQLLVDNDVEVN